MLPELKAVLATGQKRPSETEKDPLERPDKHPRYETGGSTIATGDEVSRREIDPKQVDRTRRLRSVNRSVMSMFEGTLRGDPIADLTTLFESYVHVYPDRRKRAEGRALKAALVVPPPQSRPALSQGGPLHAGLEEPPHQLPRGAKRTLKVPVGTPTVIKPLARSVIALFTNCDGSKQEPTTTESIEGSTNSVLAENLSRALDQGELLWHIPGRAVIKLSPTIVVKLGKGIDIDQVEIMSHVRQQTTKIPIPELLGVLSIAKTVYIFMSHTVGAPLERHWHSMTREQKCAVSGQLNTMLLELREIPLPPPGFGLGWNSRCKDTRRTTRRSGLITTEAEFNKFLLSDPLPRISGLYLEMMFSRLRADHRIVLTHGDLNPGNIIVAVDETGEDFTITGLVDWEMSGWYPEYWEHIKALSSFSPTTDDDWWQYLPKCIAHYHAEWALDCQLDTIIHCE